MKTVKKIVGLLSALTMLAPAAVLPASAEVEIQDSVSVAVSEVSLELDALEGAGTITAEEAQELMDSFASIQSADTTYTYPSYTTYAELAISPTTHYLVAMVDEGATLGQGSIRFFLNANLGYTNCEDLSLFTFGKEYTNSRITKIGSAPTIYPTIREVTIAVTPSPKSASSTSALFTYNLGKFDGLKPPVSEYQLHQYTSPDPTANPLSTALMCGGGYHLEKGLYSLGDVDRDGDVDNDDVTLIMNDIVGNVTVSGSEYDKVVFKLAADVDFNGEVDILDVIAINRYLNGKEDL